MSQNVIELNGKRYDAITGKMLGPSTAKAVAYAAGQHQSGGRVIDGFFRPSAATAAKPKARKAAPAAGAKTAAKTAAKTTVATKPQEPVRHIVPATAVHAKPAAATHRPASARNPIKHKTEPAQAAAVPTAVQHHAGHAHMHKPGVDTHHHQPQHSQTLRRSAVHKPELRMKPNIRPQGAAEVAARPASSIARKRSAAAVDVSRQERAGRIAKHQAVRKFHAISYGQMPVRAVATPTADAVPVIPVQPLPLLTHAPSPVQQHADIFENAIKHARSHQQPAVPRRRTHHRRFVNFAAGVAGLLILGGFVAYLNMPNIQLHIASVEAGFHASMPSYKPTGYALQGGIQHRGGTISMRFSSGDSSYQITQQSSNWDSQALLDNTLALSGPHQTVERAGRTIYVYGNGSNASWVTGNVRFDITGNASLDTDQLADIAASM
ncbi:MAG TPA: hypothetical protein VF466_03505 [Candidatus Saccharimonadales bacterium]